MIEFLEDIHLYLVDGVITPSVTQVLKKGKIGADYKSVPFSVLKSKSEYGSKVHDIIENYCLTGKHKKTNGIIDVSVDQYFKIEKQRKIKIESCEKTISYGQRYAGMYDMYGTVGKNKALIDIKTTYKYDPEYLSWQLGMYKLAMETEGMEIGKCYCLWLPKMKLADLIEVQPKSKDEIMDLLEKVNENEVDYAE